MQRSRSITLVGVVLCLLASPALAQPEFDRGDCNADGGFDVGDPIFALANLFSMGPGGPCVDACDANDDGALDIADPVFSLTYLFSAGTDLPPPFQSCGIDTTASALDCQSFPPCSASGLSHDVDIQPIWNSRCVTCHSLPFPGQGLELVDGVAYLAIVGVPSVECPPFARIEPFDSNSSYIYRKILGTHIEADILAQGCTLNDVGSQMPFGVKCCLDQGDIDLIQAWIDSGANP